MNSNNNADSQAPTTPPTAVSSRSLARRYPRLTLVLFALVFSIAFTLIRDRPGETPVYREAAQRFANGEQFYRPDDHPAFTYPPFFVLPYSALIGLAPPLDRMVWCFVNVCLLAFVVRGAAKLLTPTLQAGHDHGGPPVWLAWTVIAVLSGRFLASPLEYQGHELYVFAFITLGLLGMAAQRPTVSGCGMGLAAACKATPLLFLPVFVWQRQWRAAAFCTSALVIATLLPDVMSRNPEGKLWVQSWHAHFVSKVDVASAADAPGAWHSWNAMNQSLSGTFYRLATPITNPTPITWDVSLVALSSTMLWILTAAAKLAVILLVAYVTWQPSNKSSAAHTARSNHHGFTILNQGGAVVSAMLLLSPMTSKQHLCLLFAPIAVLVTYWLYYRRTPLITVSLLMLLVLGTMAGKDLVGLALHMQLSAYGSLTWCTLICLFGNVEVAYRLRHSAVSTVPAVGVPPRQLPQAA